LALVGVDVVGVIVRGRSRQAPIDIDIDDFMRTV